MPLAPEPAYGMLALVALGLGVFAFLVISVKVRALSARRFGVRVLDLGADLDLRPTAHTRGYRFALYLVMKSTPRETREP